MSLSVVVTTLNEDKNIDNLLRSFENQILDEIIIVDAGSTDKTRDIVKRRKEKDERIELYVKRGTRGESRNYGVEKSSSDFVAFTDGDCIVDEKWSKSLLKNSNEYKIIAGKVMNIGNSPWKNVSHIRTVFDGNELNYGTCNLMYEKELFNSLGGFDRRFITGEDIDLNFRAVKNGQKILYEPEAIVYSKPRDDILKFLKQSFYYGYGRKQFSIKHGYKLKEYNSKDLIKNMKNDFWEFLRFPFGIIGYLSCHEL
ncbi:MAG: glycosyltransferase [Candidatus Aenigmarchaeota archaeon]|nr:glycosyltransferase [Candidatus Aenigmarchaeota archaeon]